jgi:PDZ domain-containing secreted protein
VKFREDVPFKEADDFFKDINNKLKKDYYVVGVFGNMVNIESISKDAKILYIDGKQYSTDDLLDVIDKASRYDDLCG